MTHAPFPSTATKATAAAAYVSVRIRILSLFYQFRKAEFSLLLHLMSTMLCLNCWPRGHVGRLTLPPPQDPALLCAGILTNQQGMLVRQQRLDPSAGFPRTDTATFVRTANPAGGSATGESSLRMTSLFKTFYVLYYCVHSMCPTLACKERRILRRPS